MKLLTSTPRFGWITLMLIATLSITTVSLAEEQPADTQPAETQPDQDEAPASQPEDAEADADEAGAEVEDTGPNELHGSLTNLPTRAAKGWHWDGSTLCWHDRPAHYAAIHFHDDDIYDCRWETDFRYDVPGCEERIR